MSIGDDSDGKDQYKVHLLSNSINVAGPTIALGLAPGWLSGLTLLGRGPNCCADTSLAQGPPGHLWQGM
jgi:hypothetical protein